VLVDEYQLSLGRFRLRGSGSAGGHNGLKSIEGALASRDYARLRIGIGPVPPDVTDRADWVLAPFAPEEWDTVGGLLPTMVDAADCWAREGLPAAMNRVHQPRTSE
jgi:PTH1 family peptidyl-tRNA hydrolase